MARVAPPPGKRSFPMMVMRAADVLKLSRLQSYEEAMSAGLLLEWTEDMDACLFCSHTWLSYAHPDPKNEKLDLLQELLKLIFAGKLTISTHWFAELTMGKMNLSAKKLQMDLSDGYIWCDYFSVPQADKAGQAKAIASIASYVSDCAYFFVLAGAWQHTNDGSVRDRLAWARRGWCRVEQLANALSPRVKPLVIAQSSTQVATYGAIGLPFNTWLESPVGLGDFTVDADREKIYPLLDSLVERRKAVALAEGDLTWYRLLHASKAWLLKGTGTVMAEGSLQEWMHSMRFVTVHDGAETGLTPLRFACMAGRADLMRELLEQGAALEAPLKKKLPHFDLSKGATILAQACRTVATKDATHDASRTEMVKLLLERGADPLRRAGDQGVNSLWRAMVGGNLGTIDLLLKKCPALLTTNVATFGKMTWEMWTAFSGRLATFEGMQQRYPQRMAAAVSNSHEGDSFGMSLATHSLNNAGDVAMLEALLDAGDHINGAHVDSSGTEQPQLKASLPDLKLVYKLVDFFTRSAGKRQSAFVEFWAFSSRCTPLHAAAFNANLGAIKVLLSRGADVHCTRHPKCMSALHLAAMGGHVELALRLLAAGARAGAHDAKRRTCALWAYARGHVRLSRLLEELSAEGPTSLALPLERLHERLALIK